MFNILQIFIVQCDAKVEKHLSEIPQFSVGYIQSCDVFRPTHSSKIFDGL